MIVSEKEILDRILESLNENQREAVTSPCNGRLQIIAGPGTGKTKVLVSRVAHLLIVDKVRPDNMIVTTFTKKAANEMTDRLHRLLAGTNISVDKLIIGTFHSVCYRIIKRYGKFLGLEKHTIADETDKRLIMKKIISGLQPSELTMLQRMSLATTSQFTSGKVLNSYKDFDLDSISKQISSLKSKAILLEAYAKSPKRNKALVFFYQKYESALTENQKLDFDDCLMKCFQLIKEYPVLNYVKHVLVDEFQDTNEIQLQLMYRFAQGHVSNPEFQHNVTIVGDPDQSIYAFRHAQSANFKKMEKYYEKMNLSVSQITLVENYRSTSDILQYSESVMRQQKDRHQKNLRSQNDVSFKPVYKVLDTPAEQARWIVYEIEQLLALPNSPIKFEDIAILFRASSQTKIVEDELRLRKIPYRLIQGRSFWERKEVVSTMDYLKVCGDKNDLFSVLRTINFPARLLGEKTAGPIIAFIEKNIKNGLSVHDCLRLVANGKDGLKLSTRTRNILKGYVNIIDTAQERMKIMETCSGESLRHEAARLFQDIYDGSTLDKEFRKNAKDYEERRMNVEELSKLFIEFVPREETLPPYNGETDGEFTPDKRNFIMLYIESIGLFDSSAVTELGENKGIENEEQGENSVVPEFKGISLSTIHGSKGLEWPVVFVPGLSDGILPARFAVNSNGDPSKSAELINEERRCFYVATTRAKTLLYISGYLLDSGYLYGSNYSRTFHCPPSRFITDIGDNIVSQMKQYQLAFKNMVNLEMLYRLLKKDELFDKNFPVDKFYKTYRTAFKIYRRGAPMNFVIKQEEYDTLTNKLDVSLFGGFQTANNVTPQISNKRKAVVATKLNKAPPYIPSRPLKKARIAAVKNRLSSTRNEGLTTSTNTLVSHSGVNKPDIVESLRLGSMAVKIQVHKPGDQKVDKPVENTSNIGYFELSDEE